MSKRVLILCNYSGGYAAGQRFRFEQYLDILRAEGIEVTVEPFFETWVWPILWQPGKTPLKVWAVIRGLFRRILIALRATRFDYVFVHLEAAPLGPPIAEWIMFALGCRVIYDIDDAIFISRTSKNNRLAAPLRWRSKVGYVVRRSWKVTACNPFLVNWARQFNRDVTLLPTTIDPEYHRRTRVRQHGAKPVIGWTGTRSNLHYLDLVTPALIELQDKYEFEFWVICDAPPPPPALRNYRYVPWRLETEIEDLQKFDIGLMPVPDGLWEKGKVGFKAIQYAALETVAIVSDVASGPEVVIDGRTGFLVKNDTADWYQRLAWLLEHPEQWPNLGAAARDHIVGQYSVPAQRSTYLGLFR